MHIVVLTRAIPDTAASLRVDASGAVVWQGDAVMNPWDEYAIEEALLLAERHGGTVTALAPGPPLHDVALRYALSMGCNAAVRVWDESMQGGDAFGLARAAAGAILKMGNVALAITGKEAVDLGAGTIHLGAACALDWPVLTFVARVAALEAGRITVERQLERGRQTISVPLPAVLSVLKEINAPRYPTFAGMRRARDAEIAVRPPGELGVSLVERVSLAPPPAREGRAERLDVPALVERLAAEKLL